MTKNDLTEVDMRVICNYRQVFPKQLLTYKPNYRANEAGKMPNSNKFTQSHSIQVQAVIA